MSRNNIVDILTTKYPDITLKTGNVYYWSPSDKTVFYKSDDDSKTGVWSLLHESGHAILNHTNYYSDLELVKLEVEAWEKAKELARELGVRGTRYEEAAKKQKNNPVLITIDEDHIQDCLDSYRQWLHKRSLCPDCHLSSIQTDEHTYTCIFCHKKWHVTAERFCRPYRKRAIH